MNNSTKHGKVRLLSLALSLLCAAALVQLALPDLASGDGGTASTNDAAQTPDYGTNLWLEISSVTNGNVSLILHHPVYAQTGDVYEVWSKTNLTISGWNIETDVWAVVNQNWTPFTVPVLGRPTLFIWARDWTGIDENSNGVPDWWEYEHPGVLPPVITAQPTSQTVVQGNNVTFSVGVSSSSTIPLSYQWDFNGTNFLAGAINASLTLTNAQLTNAGIYSVVVTNVFGSATSSNVVLTVLVPPSVSLISPADGSRFVAPTNITLIASATAVGTSISKVQFIFGNGAELGETASASNGFYSFFWTNAPPGIYSLSAVAIDGHGVASTSSVVNITNDNVVFLEGGNLNGPAVTIEGNPWWSYTYALTNGLSVTNAVTNYVAVSNLIPPTDTGTSNMLQSLLIRYRLPPPNQQTNCQFSVVTDFTNCYVRVSLTNFPNGYMVTNEVRAYRGWCFNRNIDISANQNYRLTLYYTYGTPDPRFSSTNLNKVNYLLNHKQGTNANDIQNAIWTLLGQGNTNISGGGRYIPTTNYITMTNMACLYGTNFVPGCDQTAVVIFDPTNHQPIGVEIGGTNCDNNPKTIGFTLTQANLTNGYYYVYGWLVEDQTNYARSLNINVQGVTAATGIGTNLALGNWVKLGPYGGNVTNGALKVDVISPAVGDPILMGLAIYSCGNSNPPVSMAITPTNPILCPGLSVMLDTTVSGTGPFSYVWSQNNSTLTGQNSSSLIITNASATNAGIYTVVVTAANNKSATNSTTLTVNSVVSATPLTSLTNVSGTMTTFNTTASGTGPYGYTWYKNGAVLAGQVTNSLTLNNVGAGDAGTYSVVVDGACGAPVTNSATLIVWQPPTVVITYPASNSVFSLGAIIPINANAQSVYGYITNVKFLNGTNLLGTVTTGVSNTYAFAWTNAPLGTNMLTAMATDNRGLQTASAPVVITVNNPMPTVQITNPINQTFLARTHIPVQAIASTPSGTVSWVQFFARTNGGINYSLGYGVSTNGYYHVVWPPAFAGTNILTAEVMDSRGSNAWSAPVTNIVRSLPAVTITSPTNGQIFLTSPVNIPIWATAISDPSTVITNVTFYQGTTYQPANIIGVSTSGVANVYGVIWNGVTNGTYLLSAEAFDTNGGISFSTNVTITVETNQPPSVYAGPDQTINLLVTNTAHLFGVAMDDGLPIGSTLSVTWSCLSNFPNVTIVNSNQLDASASFSAVGKYTLQLAANDFQFTSVSTLTITVVSNQAPIVYAGPDQTVIGQTAVQLQGVATDDGQPYGTLLTAWSVVSGPDTVTFADANVTNTIATFSGLGTYHLQLSASDGQLTSSSSVNITVVESNAIPYEATNYLYIFDDGYGQNSNFYMPNYNDSFWTNGQAAFGNYGGCPLNNTNYINTYWPGNNWDDPAPGDTPAPYILLRRHFIVPPGTTNLAMGFTVDNNAQIFINGMTVSNGVITYAGSFDPDTGWFYHENCPNFDDMVITNVDSSLWHEGDNLLAVRVQDEGALSFFDSRIAINSVIIRSLPTNQPPVVAVKQSVFWTTNTVQLQGWVLDDGLPGNGQAIAMWTKVSGPGTVTFNPNPPAAPFTNYAEVDATASFSAPGTYVLQFLANDSKLSASNNVTIVVAKGVVPLPTVTLTAPTNNSVYSFGTNIIVTANATASGGYSITNVQFVAAVGSNQFLIGVATNSPYTTNWIPPIPGSYSLFAVATDNAGRVGYSTPPVNVQILPLNTNRAPVAVNDWFIVFANSHNNYLNVLGNDYDQSGNPLKIISVTRPGNGGTATIANGGTGIWYTPPYGTHSLETTNSNDINQAGDGFHYVISNGKGGTAQAAVYVGILATAIPQVTIINPPYPPAYKTNAGALLPLVAYVSPSQYITKVDFYIGETLIGEVTNGVNGSYTLPWIASYDACNCPITASASDVFGQLGVSPSIYINVTPPINGPNGTSIGPNAVLDSYVGASGTNQLASIVTIRDGLFNLYGRAYHPLGSNDVVWQLGVYTPDGTTLIRDLTPKPVDNKHYHIGAVGSSTVSGILVSNCDLTTLQNGVYDLKLTVIGGLMITNTDVQFILDSNLKLGQFSFSQQDIIIPVNGIPLTVTRTYNSLNPDKGDFGYSWTYTLGDMDVALDETREEDLGWVDDFSNVGEPGQEREFSQRSAGGRDVTLTLPNGRRTTFYYTPTHDMLGDETPAWTAAPGNPAGLTLAAQGNPQYQLPGIGGNGWVGGGMNDDMNTPYEAGDFPGFILTTPDNTRYIINREDLGTYDMDNYIVHAYGKPHLAEIDEPSDNKITINQSGITYIAPNNAQKQVLFQRNSDGLIESISDPNGQGSGGPPAVKYEYDSYNNLINVERLVDRNLGTYVTNTFTYTNANFPHYITSMFNGDGTQVAENFYDDSGKLIAIQDANGNLTQFIHNMTNDMDIVIDRLGNTNTYIYDLRGNVIAQTNALGQMTTMAYDNNNNKTNNVVYLNGQPYATNSYVYNGNNLLLASTDPIGHTNGFTYDNYGDLLTSADARGNTTANTYDGGGNLTSTRDALGDTTVNSYSGGLLASSTDAIGTITANSYDNNDNLIGTATLEGVTGAILSSNTFTYDGNGNRLTSTVWRQVNGVWKSALTTYIYDAMNRVVQTINPDSGTNTVVYNLIGQQQATIDPLGRATTYDYDNQGRLWRTTYPDLTTELSYYDANGNRTNSVDRAGRTTTFVYDALNRLVQTIYPDNTTNRTVYDDVGRVAQTIDARGAVTAFNYDAAGRRLAVTNAVGIAGLETVSSYAYDANGNQITFTDGLGHTTTNVFDALNRQVAVDYPDGTKTLTGYDADGRRVAATNQDTIVTLFGYDGAGRLTSVTNAANTQPTVTRFVYDTAGNETAQIDALGRTNTFVYDSMGRRIGHTLPGGQTEGFAYDWAGNLIYQTNFNGAVITNQYDVMNRLTNQASVNGYKVGYVYTLTGQRQSMTDPSGATSYSYDTRDRLLLKTIAWNNGPTVSLNYRYDANGNVTNLWSSTANGVNLVYSYDPLNRLANVVGQASSLSQYAYDAVGNLQSMRYGNGVMSQYQYDSLNRLTNLTSSTVSGTIASFYYQLGLTGNRKNLSEKVGIGATARTYAWNYDALYRMTNEVLSGIGNAGYAYDPVGNRTNRNSTISKLPTTSYNYNTNDWLTTDKYDNNGNTTNSSGNFYQYDALNQVTNVNNTIFITYDGDENRMSKTVGGTTTYYLLDDRNPSGYMQVLEEYQGSTLSRVYNYGLDLISQKTGGTTYYFGRDGHGSTRFLLNTSGEIVETYVYDAYGTLISGPTTPSTVYFYCGQQYDPDLGLYLNRARYLNPQTGRFWTMDSFGGNQSDPLSLHKYLYCQDEPVNNTDPSGNSVYVCTRPLNILGLNILAPAADHVFLAFDTDGITSTADLNKWTKVVEEGNRNVTGQYSRVNYCNDPYLTTFSFHPYSVYSDNNERSQLSAFVTSGSYVAYNDGVDHNAFYRAGENYFGYGRSLVTSDLNEQIMLYTWAIKSRNENNSGHPDAYPYSALSYDCASWTYTIVKERGQLSYPLFLTNLGVGIHGPLAPVGAGITGLARGWNPQFDPTTGGLDLFDFSF
jgi:RHS repeat-associated protein